MLKAYTYRLYPNNKQREKLQWTLDRAIVQKELEERWHHCSCGCSLDRDHNAAKNILRLGLQALEQESRARTERSKDAPLRSPRL